MRTIPSSFSSSSIDRFEFETVSVSGRKPAATLNTSRRHWKVGDAWEVVSSDGLDVLWHVELFVVETAFGPVLDKFDRRTGGYSVSGADPDMPF